MKSTMSIRYLDANGMEAVSDGMPEIWNKGPVSSFCFASTFFQALPCARIYFTAVNESNNTFDASLVSKHPGKLKVMGAVANRYVVSLSRL